MSEHMIQLWVTSDADLSQIDWQELLPAGADVEHAEVRSFPWGDVEHVITWWITRRLSPEEWGELDDAESDVLARIVGDGNFQGMAGPIPEEPETELPGEADE